MYINMGNFYQCIKMYRPVLCMELYRSGMEWKYIYKCVDIFLKTVMYKMYGNVAKYTKHT